MSCARVFWCARKLKLHVLLTVVPTAKAIMALDSDHNDQVEEIEFVMGMLNSLGVELYGVSLNQVVATFRKTFKIYDRRGKRYLTGEDLERYVADTKRSAIDRKSANHSSRRSVSDLDGVGEGWRDGAVEDEASGSMDPLPLGFV